MITTLFYDGDYSAAAVVTDRVNWQAGPKEAFAKLAGVKLRKVWSTKVTRYKKKDVWYEECAIKPGNPKTLRHFIYVMPDADNADINECKAMLFPKRTVKGSHIRVVRFKRRLEFVCPKVVSHQPELPFSAPAPTAPTQTTEPTDEEVDKMLEADRSTQDLTPLLQQYFLPFATDEMLTLLEIARVVLSTPRLRSVVAADIDEEGVEFLDGVRAALYSLMNSELSIKDPRPTPKDIKDLSANGLREASHVAQFVDSLKRAMESAGVALNWDASKLSTLQEFAKLVAPNKIRFIHDPTEDSKSEEEISEMLKIHKYL